MRPGRVPHQHRARVARRRGRARRGARRGPSRRRRARRRRWQRRGAPPPAAPRERRADAARRRRHARDAVQGAEMIAAEIARFAAGRRFVNVVNRERGGRVSDELLLAIDAGTGSCRAVLFDARRRQVAIGQREYSHPELPGVPGSQVFETDANWRLDLRMRPRGARRVRRRRRGQGGQRDEHARGHGALRRARARDLGLPERRRPSRRRGGRTRPLGAAQEIYERAGDWVAITAPARFLWIAQHQPEVFASIAHVGMLGDWILTQAVAASSSPTRRWARAPACSSSPSATGRIGCSSSVASTAASSRRSSSPGRWSARVTADGRRADRAAAGNAGRGRRRRHSARAARASASPNPGRFTIVGGSFWQRPSCSTSRWSTRRRACARCATRSRGGG